MNSLTLAAITAFLSIIEEFVIPLVTKGATTDQVNKIIDAIEQFLPAIGNQVTAVYQTLKNIVTALSATPGTPQEQYDRLRALDASIDALNDAAMAAVDPDVGDNPASE